MEENIKSIISTYVVWHYRTSGRTDQLPDWIRNGFLHGVLIASFTGVSILIDEKKDERIFSYLNDNLIERKDGSIDTYSRYLLSEESGSTEIS